MSELRVVVGASHAGAELALRLRQHDAARPVLLLGDEVTLPYQRPPLSKSWLADPQAKPEALLQRGAAAYENTGVTLAMGERVTAIDRESKGLLLASGKALAYGQLALATGARVRRLAAPGADQAERAANFHYLRTLADAVRLRPQLEPGARIAIVGGGYIGLELAALAMKGGLRVTVLEAMPRVLARVTAPELSAFYEQVHRDAGVEVRTGMEVVGFRFEVSDGSVAALLCRTAAGAPVTVEADVVVVGVGVAPNTELAVSAGLAVDNGIVVDEWARTSAPDIVAAGDCTSHPVPGHQGLARLESVPNALDQARTAAATLCGLDQPCRAPPWFWSDQYDLKLQMVGLSRGYDSLVVRGSMDERSFCAFYLRAGRIIAVDAVNRPGDFMIARKLVAAGTTATAEVLTDRGSELKNLLAA
jgi:3-phenylpropionate/trans-cinnamate dioxygenase ferredoxin reductase subunit